MIELKRELAVALDAGDQNAVLTALQQAIELEHATIPTYLYALYSIVPGRNRAIAQIISSIVVDEMLHLALASNVLNALGGSPVLDKPDFIPSYPGPLPGAVEAGLTVPLEPCSLDLVTSVFMVIEQPEDPLSFPVVSAAAKAEEPLTIGQFYRSIKERIVALGDSVFVPGPRNQIGPDQMDQAVVVTDVATASQAIDTIIEQGEGTSTAPLEIVGTGYAHFYRFSEIAEGGLLVPNPDAGPDTPPDDRYFYDTVNRPVSFDADGVYPVPKNPKVNGTTTPTYPPGSVGQVANDNFNYTYTNLLKVLHEALNGQARLLDTAIGMMMSLRQQAMDMASGTNTGGANVGPSFEYQPVNPGLLSATG
jgi:hypothetical protein